MNRIDTLKTNTVLTLAFLVAHLIFGAKWLLWTALLLALGNVLESRATTVIAVGMGEDPSSWLGQYFGEVTRAARIANAAGVDNEEQGQSIWLCRQPLRPWSEMWPQFQHYD